MNVFKSNEIIHVFVTACVSWCLLLWPGAEGLTRTQGHSDVDIDLRYGVVKGYNPYVSFLHRPTSSVNRTCNSQAVIRVSFPGPNGGLRLRLSYGKEGPKLWTLHVSDSPTANGFGGRDNTTSNNAEFNVHNRQLRLYGNDLPTSVDAAMNGGRLIKVYDNFVKQDSKVAIEISDERFEWKRGRLGDIIESPFLFTLSGQKPTYGSRDDYVYIGLNRVVGGAYRQGSGLCHVHIRVHHPPQHCSRGTHNCHRDAICTDTRRSFRCKCKPGFNGDGKLCKDEDECSYENGGCVHRCVNTQGSFHCACKSGFELTANGKNCLDVNECFNNKGSCSHQCINSLGSYECGCSKGYSLNFKGKSCVFGEWCRSNFGCSHSCRTTSSGKVECYCREGFYLHQNGQDCLRSCSHGNGGCHHVCNDTASGPKCSCALKYFINADNKTCTASCAVSNGGCERKCNDTPLGPKCSCPSGFKLHQDEKTCLDIDECATGAAGCSHQCENTRGGFECVCPSGFKVAMDYKTCVDIDECQLKSMCDHRCENLPGSFMCHCRQGYQKFGITHCADKNECAERNGGCSHGCTNTQGGYTCSCVPGFKLHPNKHDCIDAKQCIRLRPRPDINLVCKSSLAGEVTCTVTCKGQGYLVTGHRIMNETEITIACGPSTKYTWLGIVDETLPECSKLVVAASFQRMARVLFLKKSCDFDDRNLEDVRLNMTKAFNSEKKFKCSNRCRVNYVNLQCGSRRKKFKKLMRRSKKVLLTAEFQLQMGAKNATGDCDAICVTKKNQRRFNRVFKKLRRAIKRNKFSIKLEGRDYKAIKKSLKAGKQIKSICPEGTDLVNKTCVGCLPGNAFDKKTKSCQPCPKGSYQDENGKLECKPCPDRTPGSGREGAASLKDCSDMCEPGTFASYGMKPCQKCGIGTFQPHFGRITCVPCGGGLSTRGIGSKYFDQCISKVSCKPGSYYSTVSHKCVTCGRGFYQPLAGQEFCMACPGKTTTDFSGATSSDACKDMSCGQHMGDHYGILESPNYPGNYPNNVQCVWKIKPEKGRRILIIVPEIYLSDRDQCGDIIIMRKSRSAYSQSTFETCESRQRPIAFTARSKKLWIQFKSDGNNTAKGFSIPFVAYSDDYQSLIEDIVRDGRLYSSKQHQQIFHDRQLLTVLLEVIATPYNYLKYANDSHSMFPQSFFRLLTPKVTRFFRT